MAPPNSATPVRLGGGRVYVRPLTGADERLVTHASLRAALGLLDRILLDAPAGVAGPGQASSLTAAERDRVFATVHTATFGERIATSGRCTGCGEQYDLDFDLDVLVDSLQPTPPRREAQLRHGTVVRVPTGADELAIADEPGGDPVARLLARCVVEGQLEDIDPDEASAALEKAAPTLDPDLDAACPECGTKNVLRFNMQDWLLRRLEQGLPRMWAEVHVLARAYGWSLTELLALTGNERRRLVEQLDAEGR